MKPLKRLILPLVLTLFLPLSKVYAGSLNLSGTITNNSDYPYQVTIHGEEGNAYGTIAGCQLRKGSCILPPNSTVTVTYTHTDNKYKGNLTLLTNAGTNDATHYKMQLKYSEGLYFFTGNNQNQNHDGCVTVSPNNHMSININGPTVNFATNGPAKLTCADKWPG